VLNQHAARGERRNQAFAEALAAVEQYMELPFRVRRRRDGIAARHELGAAISDVQASLAQHQGWLDLVAPTYRALVTAARREAGSAMSTACLEAPITRDEEMNLGVRFSRKNTDAARARCINAMHDGLRLRPGRRPRRTATAAPDPNAWSLDPSRPAPPRRVRPAVRRHEPSQPP
jgi:hypothetical protein